MREIIYKEFRELLFSPVFLVLAVASFCLILISLFNGYAEYSVETSSIARNNEISRDELRTKNSYRYAQPTIYREPSVLSIFDNGVSGVMGRRTTVTTKDDFILSASRGNSNPIFVALGELDMTFIVVHVLTLFALLMTFDAVSGEKERGTLSLMMSNSIRRPSVITGKLLGRFGTVLGVFLIPFLFGLAILMLATEVRFGAAEWSRLGLMLAGYALLLLVFCSIGLAMSAIGRRSLVSFILCLSIWVLYVGVVPRIAANVAHASSPIMNRYDLRKELWKKIENISVDWHHLLKQYYDEHNIHKNEYREKQTEAYDWVNEQYNKLREEAAAPVWQEYYRLRTNRLLTTGFYARFSPASTTEVLQHQLADTGPGLYYSFRDNIKSYARELDEYIQPKIELEKIRLKKQRENPTTKWTDEGRLIVVRRPDPEEDLLDLSGMPQFVQRLPEFEEIAGDVFTNLGVLFGYAIVFFAIAYVAFLRYDVR